MRIRKNAKISTFIQTNINLSSNSDEYLLHNTVCQLNQSPWDLITFPSPDSSSSLQKFDDNEVYYNVNLSENWSSAGSMAAFESVTSMKTSSEGEKSNAKNDHESFDEIPERETIEPELASSEIQEQTVLCDKTDVKGWQCGRPVKHDHETCDHHLVQTRTIWPAKKKQQPVVGPNTARQKKKRAATNAGPHEFYYYSGFGPSWAKKRGAQDNKNTIPDDRRIRGPIEIDDDVGVGDGPTTFETGPTTAELDYMEEEEEVVGNVVRKRGRKPIKARSLKSLM